MEYKTEEKARLVTIGNPTLEVIGGENGLMGMSGNPQSTLRFGRIS